MSINVTALLKQYGEQKAVDGISFSLQKGEIVGFLGPNGAGKSTTMKIITGYLPPTGGSASVCGFDVAKAPLEVRRRVGYLPEANPLYPDMYIREFLEFAAGMHGLGKGASARIDEMILRTGLTPERHKKIGMLSKGYKQRVGLAQALLHDPEVLILDEPTSGLDPNQLADIRRLIRELGENKTVMLSTHIMQEVEALCSRAIIINKGHIIADGAISSLRQGASGFIQVAFAEETAPADLEALPGVQKVTPAEGNAWRLYTADPETVRKNLLQFALINNRNILSLQSNSLSLEDVFRELTN
ncbi:gliding motility-associated ABC transporter ATP-binding subunit GldA [Chitinophaga rhizosphaerae]|uniref:gliding motility-associated ABC transporter ATP-binding subunit GldA n=1 Tax=Chitinophaga rhizosphaerae TaxID=1864947 RepID=UPI000F81569A|nr:gliding motility-associated ABC transporter ATP-binding subunit GldA [Chitinophaga rhizosphaerae]